MAEAHQSGSERLPGATGVKSPETEQRLHQITQGNVSLHFAALKFCFGTA